MTIKLTPVELAALGPCKDYTHLFGRRRSMTATQAIKAGASLSDLLWVARRLGLKTQCVRFDLACAQRVAHFNPDPRVQAALDATQAWLDNPSDITASAAWAAAWDAGAAGDAANAADAAWAAWAARATAGVAGGAAGVAWAAGGATAGVASIAAANAVCAAAWAAEHQAQIKIFLEIFK